MHDQQEEGIHRLTARLSSIFSFNALSDLFPFAKSCFS